MLIMETSLVKKGNINSLELAYKEITKLSFNDNKQNMEGGCAAFGYVEKNIGEVENHIPAACYAPLSGFKNAGAVYAWHKSAKPFEELNRKFLAFIQDPKVSPWREIVELNPPVQIKPFQKYINTPEFIYDHGFIVYNLKVPGNLLGNYLIAGRWIWEHAHHVETWDLLVTEYGIHPAVALYLSANFIKKTEGNDKSKYSLSGYDAGHHALNVSNVGMDYFENFCHGKTCVRTENFDVRPNYLPCNVVWGANVGGGYDHRGNRVNPKDGVVKYRSHLIKEYCETVVDNGAFGGGAVGTKPIVLEHLARIAAAEQARIGL